MNLPMKKCELRDYVSKQLSYIFPDNTKMVGNDIDVAFEEAILRLEFCFKNIAYPAYSDEKGNTFFSHLHMDQYAQFLYFFSNSLWKTSENKAICDKLLCLNRYLNGIFISYKGRMPDIFFLNHPVGSVVGNASYSDGLVISQNVTINTGKRDGEQWYPILGKGLTLSAGAIIIGNGIVGDRVSIGVGTVIYKTDIEDDTIVFNAEGKGNVIKMRTKECAAQKYFRIEL